VNIFRLGHRSIYVEVFKVNGTEMGPIQREDTVEKELDELQ
jgi:hypothetical protein